jgi:hypothetical protein
MPAMPIDYSSASCRFLRDGVCLAFATAIEPSRSLMFGSGLGREFFGEGRMYRLL